MFNLFIDKPKRVSFTIIPNVPLKILFAFISYPEIIFLNISYSSFVVVLGYFLKKLIVSLFSLSSFVKLVLFNFLASLFNR
ncbi:MAG: hypothetical protein AABZ74_19100 [Cyanobacteriota bacterium]